MKRRLAAFVGILCVACLIVSGAYAKKPNQPGQSPNTECIVFTGDLESAGETVISGCCPNAGPAPAYKMYLDVMNIGERVGHLFVKPVSTRVNRQWTERWKVQFWTWDWAARNPGSGDYFLEIYSDDDDIVVEDENGVTVIFDDDTATVWVYYDMDTDCDPCDPSCEPCPTLEVPPACDLCESDCRHPHRYCCLHPCNEEITIEDVSFVLVKTSDLTYCAALP